jgi:hypothetical protein
MKNIDPKRFIYFYITWIILFVGFILIQSLLPIFHKSDYGISILLLVLVVFSVFWLIKKYASKVPEVDSRGPSQWFLLYFVILVIPFILYKIFEHWSPNLEWKAGLGTFIIAIFFMANVGVVVFVILSYFKRKGPGPPR